MDNFARKVFVLNHQYPEEEIRNLTKDVVEFAKSRKMLMRIYKNERLQKFTIDVSVQGCTSKYCLGCIAEIETLLKFTLKCEMVTVFIAA